MTENKIVSIKGKEYTISFPNVGQYYDIEALKQSLGKGYYNALLGNHTKAASDALDMIDIEATVRVLMPDLIKDMKVSNFRELGIKDFMEIRRIYDKEIFPFLKEVQMILNPPPTEK